MNIRDWLKMILSSRKVIAIGDKPYMFFLLIMKGG